MHRTDRLTAILLALQSGPRSASDLASRFEVSRRTIMRDIDALDQIGVPVIAETGRNGGYRIADGYWMPPLHLTADEATVLLFALQHVGDGDRSPLGAAHRSVLEKLQTHLTPGIAPDVVKNLESLIVLRDQDTPDPAIVTLLRDALGTGQWIAIRYTGNSGPSERSILPLRIYTSGGRWYADAVDTLRSARRIFRISRITSARRTVTPANAAAAIVAAEAGMGAYHAPEHPRICARLTPRGVAFAVDHPDLRAHVHGRSLEFHCPPGEIPYYGREFLRLGTDIVIESPPELIAWMDNMLLELSEHHRSSQKR